jgi:hypothetical protein
MPTVTAWLCAAALMLQASGCQGVSSASLGLPGWGVPQQGEPESTAADSADIELSTSFGADSSDLSDSAEIEP